MRLVYGRKPTSFFQRHIFFFRVCVCVPLFLEETDSGIHFRRGCYLACCFTRTRRAYCILGSLLSVVDDGDRFYFAPTQSANRTRRVRGVRRSRFSCCLLVYTWCTDTRRCVEKRTGSIERTRSPLGAHPRFKYSKARRS